jgi:hypothetical protein
MRTALNLRGAHFDGHDRPERSMRRRDHPPAPHEREKTCEAKLLEPARPVMFHNVVPALSTHCCIEDI